jgi:hypothetical protein
LSLPVGFDHWATTNYEVDLAVCLLECTIGVASLGRWRRCPFLAVVVLAVVVILTTSIVAPVVATVIMALITTITVTTRPANYRTIA